MQIKVEPISRVPSVVRAWGTQWLLLVGRTWQRLREELARETYAKDQSDGLNDSQWPGGLEGESRSVDIHVLVTCNRYP